jgi:SpoVK/Ycf46/Vps4 family AAA+-type ATPase
MCKKHRRTLKASPQGKILIKEARKKIGWIIEDERWLEEAIEILKKTELQNVNDVSISQMTWRRFLWGKEAINENSFKALCKVLKLDWEDVVKNHQADAKTDLNEAPYNLGFYGRTQKLVELKKWLIQERCRLVLIYGMGGIGKSALARNLVDKIADQYDYVIWLSLESAPAFQDIAGRLTQFLSKGEKQEADISLLMQYLHNQRCLIVLDAWEEITGDESEEYTSYKGFIERVAQESHKSSLLLLSREKSKDIAILEGQSVRLQRLGALSNEEAKEILIAKGLSGTDKELEEFSRRYSNPWILREIADNVRAVFHDSISPFMDISIFVNDEITNFLDIQFQKLTKAEINIIYWVALRRNSALWNQLVEDSHQVLSYNQLFQVLNDLIEKRSLLAKNIEYIPILYILDPVILKYTTNRFVQESSKEIIQLVESKSIQGSELLITHSFITENPKDEDEVLNNEQIRRIVKPIQRILLAEYNQQFKSKLEEVQPLLQDKKSSQGYASQNISYLMSDYE